MEESLRKFMSKSAKRHEENSNLIKEIRASTNAAIRNQGASIKTLEIQIGQMSKVLQERGFGSLPSSTETNLRDHVKLISTTIEADMTPKKGSHRLQCLDAYSYGATCVNYSLPQKEKDLGGFTLPCYINNVCFENTLADLGANVNVMPLSTYLNLGLGELAHTKLTVELADRIVKHPKGIAENVLVGIGKFVFPVDFIILDMPEDVKLPLILRRHFLSTAHAKIDVFKRKITLRVGDEKIIFKSVKPSSSLIKRVYMLSLRELMELDLEARLMEETLVLNRSLEPLYGDYIELNDLNVPLELRRNQVDDLMSTIEEGEVINKPMIDIIMTRNNESFDEYPSFCDYDRKIHIDYAYNLRFSCMIVVENMDGYQDQDMGDVIFREPFCKASCVEARRFDRFYSNEDVIESCMSIPSLRPLIMEYLVKISKKARILELKRRHLKITILISYTPYPSGKIRRICACTSQESTKIQSLIRRSSSKSKIIESRISNNSEPNQSWVSNDLDVPSSSLVDFRFGNDQIAKIIGYGDYRMGNIMISRVYYVQGLCHNLFSVGQLCDSDLEVAFHKHTCYIRDLEGVDLLKGSRGSNLYTLSLEDMMLSSPICILSKASKTNWLWHQRLSHLNFDYITTLAKQGLVGGLPRLKFQKDHLCFACALRKSKKHSYKPKAENFIQEKLYLLHMDLCGPMRIQSIHGRKYILVIIEDYYRFTWVKFLRSKDEVPEFVIKFLKMIQVCLNVTIQNIKTDNGTEFVNQTLRAYYEDVRISHQHRKPDLSYLHVFGALCYPTNDSEDLGKLKPKADIGIFIGPGPQLMTPRTISLGLVPNPPSPTPYVPPTKKDYDILFQPMFDEYFSSLPSVASLVPAVIIPEPVNSTESSSRDAILTNVYSVNQPPKHLRKWTKDHPLDNVTGNPSRPVSTRHQLQTEDMFCYFDDFLTSVEAKNYKEALKESCWIEAMQEELNEFERLKVWELVPRPDRVMIITLKRIFKVKLDKMGGVLQNKARHRYAVSSLMDTAYRMS
ncbi:retrovirus-related pol polyprotein from transposon TNT 1-94 [Tanacetum coccineum]